MKRDYRLYLDDMLEAIGKIERYTKGLSYEQFRKDDKTIDAINWKGEINEADI